MADRISIAQMREARDLACLDLIEEDDFTVLLELLDALRAWLATSPESVRYPTPTDCDELASLLDLFGRFDFDDVAIDEPVTEETVRRSHTGDPT